MCTRYLIRRAAADVARATGVDTFPLPHPRYNAAPKQTLPIVRKGAGSAAREAALLQWGLVPAWNPSRQTSGLLINARAETITEKPSFRAAFRHRRCVAPADGFYEWKPTATGPRPWLFEPNDPEALLLLAGVWERWEKVDAAPLESFALITTTPNAAVEPFHDRMPCLIPAEQLDAWLDPHTPEPVLRRLLQPCNAELLRCRPVHPRLNDVRIDDPSCLDTAPPLPPTDHQLALGIG